MSTQEAPNEQQTDWTGVAILFVAGCTASFHIGKVPASLPAVTENLQLTLFGASLVVSLFSVLIGCLGLIVGVATGRIGYRQAALTGLLMSGLASLFGATADDLDMLLVSRAMEGAGWLLVAVSMPVLMTRCSSTRDRPLVLGLWGAFVPVGMLVMLLLSPLVLEISGWRAVWALTGLLSLSALCVIYFRADTRSATAPVKISVSIVKSVLWRPAPLLMGFSFLLYSAMFTQVNSFIPTLLLAQSNVALQSAATLAAVVVTGNIIGNVASGWLLRLGVNRFFLLALAMGMMGVLSLFVFPASMPVVVKVLAAMLFSAFGGLVPGTLFATAPLVVEDASQVGLINGLIIQAAGCGQLIGPPLLAMVVDAAGLWDAGAWVTGGLAILGLAGALVFASFGLIKKEY